MFRTLQFVTEEFRGQKVFLPDHEYGLALDCLTKAVADVLIESADGSLLLLGKRNTEPQPDWWFVGGRMRPGESTTEAAARNVKRETGVEVRPGRFKVVANYSFVWGKRAQPPMNNGTADISTVHTVRLTTSEEALISKENMDQKEYDDVQWMRHADVLAGTFNPALQQAVADLLARRTYEQLVEAVHRQPIASDEEISFLAKNLIQRHEAGTDQAPIKVTFRSGCYEVQPPGNKLPEHSATLTPVETGSGVSRSRGIVRSKMQWSLAREHCLEYSSLHDLEEEIISYL